MYFEYREWQRHAAGFGVAKPIHKNTRKHMLGYLINWMPAFVGMTNGGCFFN
jgi:hypothetical protein